MLDAIKYSSLQLRESKGPCSPRGPFFDKAKAETIRFPLCTLTLRLPRHSPKRGDETEQRKPHRGLHKLEGSSYNGDAMPSESWQQSPVANRKWAFKGPWFTGYKGHVAFSIQGLTPLHQNPEMNFLHPKAFEVGVLGFLTARWGHKLYDEGKEIPYYQAPLNWTPLAHLPVPALQLDLGEAITSGSRYRMVFLAVAKNKLIHVHFQYWQGCTGSQQEQDQKIDPKPMQDLIDNIIRSIQLTPSPELESELAKIKKSCPELSISPECAPLKWPADVNKDGITILEYDKRRYTTPNY